MEPSSVRQGRLHRLARFPGATSASARSFRESLTGSLKGSLEGWPRINILKAVRCVNPPLCSARLSRIEEREAREERREETSGTGRTEMTQWDRWSPAEAVESGRNKEERHSGGTTTSVFTRGIYREVHSRVQHSGEKKRASHLPSRSLTTERVDKDGRRASVVVVERNTNRVPHHHHVERKGDEKFQRAKYGRRRCGCVRARRALGMREVCARKRNKISLSLSLCFSFSLSI